MGGIIEMQNADGLVGTRKFYLSELDASFSTRDRKKRSGCRGSSRPAAAIGTTGRFVPAGAMLAMRLTGTATEGVFPLAAIARRARCKRKRCNRCNKVQTQERQEPQA
jgi:hypothetical protein